MLAMMMTAATKHDRLESHLPRYTLNDYSFFYNMIHQTALRIHMIPGGRLPHHSSLHSIGFCLGFFVTPVRLLSVSFHWFVFMFGHWVLRVLGVFVLAFPDLGFGRLVGTGLEVCQDCGTRCLLICLHVLVPIGIGSEMRLGARGRSLWRVGEPGAQPTWHALDSCFFFNSFFFLLHVVDAMLVIVMNVRCMPMYGQPYGWGETII